MRLIVLKGMTIVETLVVLSIISFIVISSLALLPIISEKQDITRAQKNLKFINMTIIDAQIGNKAETSITNSHSLPKNLKVRPGGLESRFRPVIIGVWGIIILGKVNFEGASVGNQMYHKIQYDDVPSSACTSFVLGTYKDHLKVFIDGVTFTDAAQVQPLCTATDAPKVVMFINKKT